MSEPLRVTIPNVQPARKAGPLEITINSIVSGEPATQTPEPVTQESLALKRAAILNQYLVGLPESILSGLVEAAEDSAGGALLKGTTSAFGKVIDFGINIRKALDENGNDIWRARTTASAEVIVGSTFSGAVASAYGIAVAALAVGTGAALGIPLAAATTGLTVTMGFLSAVFVTINNDELVEPFEDLAGEIAGLLYDKFSSNSNGLERNGIYGPSIEDSGAHVKVGIVDVGEAIPVPVGSGKSYDVIFNADGKEVIGGLGGTLSNPQDVSVTQTPDGKKVSVIAKDATTEINGSTHKVSEVVNAAVGAGEAFAGFVSKQVKDGIKWLTDGNSAVQIDIANWLAGNLKNLVDGHIGVDEAFISLAKYVATQRIGAPLANSIIDATGAKAAFSKVFEAVGVTGSTIGVNGQEIKLADQYASSAQVALARMAIDFALNSDGWEARDYVNSGLTTITSTIAFTYGQKFFESNGLNASGAAAAVTTLVSGLLRSGDYDRGDWLNLGAQVGISYGSYVGAQQLLIMAKIFGANPGTAPVAIAAAILSLIAGKIQGKLFGSKIFYEGQFGEPALVINSIYSIEKITDANGQIVDALVARNSKGSTVLAKGIATILGGVGDDVLVDQAGVNSNIQGGTGSDYLEGRAGDDALAGGDGSDLLNGGVGNDVLQGDAGDDSIFGEDGNDTALGGAGDDFIHLGSGDDIGLGGDGNDSILASAGNDFVYGEAGNDMLDGGEGDDLLVGDGGNDTILGDLGNDSIEGGTGSDILFGDDGNDSIVGGDGNDYIDGGAGSDILTGNSGNDLIVGGAGDDFADGGLGDDDLLGGASADVLLGGVDNDYANGGEGNDSIFGDAGNDTLIGGAGTDTMEGGKGDDVYVLSADATDANNQLFDVGGNDRILLSWLTQTNSAGLSLNKIGENLEIKYSGRVLADVMGQFSGSAIESIVLGGGAVLDLSTVQYDATTGAGSFAFSNLASEDLAAIVTAHESTISSEIITKDAYFNSGFLDNLSQIAYDERFGAEIDHEYYNGTEIKAFFRKRGLLGGKYTVYELDTKSTINGYDSGIGYYALGGTAENQKVAHDHGLGKQDLQDGYTVAYTNADFYSMNLDGAGDIADIVINGQVVFTRQNGSGIIHQPGATIDGYSFADRQEMARRNLEAEAQAQGISVDKKESVKGQGPQLIPTSHFKTDIATQTIGEDLLVGEKGNEKLDGRGGNDVLIGNSGNDTLLGGDGDDWLMGGDGDDSATGGNGTDVVMGGAGKDTLLGGAGNDAVLGDAGDDSILGEAGDDWLDGGTGNDTVDAGDNNDIVHAGEGNDSVSGGAGNDILHGEAGVDTLFGGDGNDILYGGDGNDVLSGGAGNDILDGGSGASSINGGDGEDRVTFRSSSSGLSLDLAQIFGNTAVQFISVEGVEGTNFNDTITGLTSVSSVLYGLAGDDSITGGSANDIIEGGIGNDRLNGNAGNDKINGDDGDDTILGGDGNDFVYGSLGKDSIDGGAGNDTVTYAYSAAAITANLATNVVSGGDAAGDTLAGIENLEGSAQNDTITGSLADNNLYGGAGNDAISAGDGNDALFGGAGADSLDGGAGTDAAYYFYSGAAVNVNLAANTGAGGEAQGDSFRNIENLIGSNHNDTLVGDAGANTLDGGNGNDSLTGGTGDDRFVIGVQANTTDTITDFVTAGAVEKIDLTAFGYTQFQQIFALMSQVGADVRIALPNSQVLLLKNITLANLTFDDFVGVLGKDGIVTGTAGNDSITASYTDTDNDKVGTGNDTIRGLDGNDLLDGGAGADSMDGGAGNDTITYAASTAAVNVNLAISTVQFGGHAEGDVLANVENVIGSAFADILGGSAAANAMQGGDGNDTIYSSLGADSLNGGAGTDVLTYYYSEAAISINLQTNVNTGGDAQGDVLSGIEDIQASKFNDTLVGDAAANTLSGGDGNDLLDGGAGADRMDGGAGNDTISYAGATAAVTVDLAIATAQFGSHAAGDTLMGFENVIGSAYNDILYGNTAANSMQGGAGDDNLFGSAGADSMDGGAGADVVNYFYSAAAVTINLSTNTATGGDATGDILVGIENLEGSGSNDSITGSATDNNLYGGAGNDTLDGGNGSDVLFGGAGDDRFVVGRQANTTDTIADFATAGTIEKIDLSAFNYTQFQSQLRPLMSQVGADVRIALPDNQVLVLRNTSLSALTFDDFVNVVQGQDSIVTGTAGNDTITPTSYQDRDGDKVTAGNDRILGMDGNDLLDGGAGADIIDGGNGNDTVSYANAPDAVTVSLLSTTAQFGSHAAGDVLTNIENVIGSAFNDMLYGSAVANILQGGAGNDNLFSGAGADRMDGGDGIDVANYFYSTAAVNINLTTNTATGGDAAGDTLVGIEIIEGSSYNDSITGGTVDNFLYGGAGNDTISGGDGNDALFGGAGADSIEGGNGNDALYYSYSTAAVNVNLATNAASGGEAQGDSFRNMENIIGSNHNDTLTGNAVSNILDGSAGNDLIEGGAGVDLMTGGTGADIFKFRAVGDSGKGQGFRDIIMDFNAGQRDIIDLSDFAGTFTFRGTSAFSGSVMQVNFVKNATNTIINIDTNGDRVDDLQIELNGSVNLTAADFVL